MTRDVFLNDIAPEIEAKPKKLSELLKKRREELEAKLEVSHLERELEEDKKKMEELKNTAPSTTGQVTAGSDPTGILRDVLKNPDFQKGFMAMSDEARDNYMQAITKFVALSDPELARYRPFTLETMMHQAQKGSTINDLIAFGKYQMELMQASQASTQDPDKLTTKDMLKLMIETMKQRDSPRSDIAEKLLFETLAEMKALRNDHAKIIEDQYKARLEERSNQPSLEEQITHYKAIGDAIGLKSGSSDRDVELRRLDLEKWKHEQDMADNRWRFEQEIKRQEALERYGLEQKHKEGMLDIAKELIKRARPIIDKTLDRTGDAIESVGKPQRSEVTEDTQSNEKTFICTTCKNTITVPDPIPDKFKCGQCGTIFEREK